MKRTHAITPTDSCPPANPAWSYSKPHAPAHGRYVWIDAMQIPMALQHQAAADKRGNGPGWGKKGK
jgi:hypothetical protein